MRELSEREKWFIDRIGKIIFRTDNICQCKICKDVAINGLYLIDKGHALYVAETEAEYNFEGIPLKYFDTKEERDEYEKTLTKNK